MNDVGIGRYYKFCDFVSCRIYKRLSKQLFGQRMPPENIDYLIFLLQNTPLSQEVIFLLDISAMVLL